MVKLDYDLEEGGSKEEEVIGRKSQPLRARGELTQEFAKVKEALMSGVAFLST